MKRRSIIRGIFILPVLLCIGGWVTNCIFPGIILYTTKHQLFEFEINDGELILWWATPSADEYRTTGFSFIGFANIANKGSQNYYPHALGFYGGINTDPMAGGGTVQTWLIGFPFWFLTLLATLIAFWVWRKTKPKTKLGAGFPVIVKGGTQP